MFRLQSLIQPSNNLQPRVKVLSRLIHSNFLMEDIKKGFHKSLPKIVTKVLRENTYLDQSGIQDKLQKATEYNITTVNNMGGATLLHAYGILKNSADLTEESLQQAFVLAWAVEMVHSYCLLMENVRGLDPDFRGQENKSANDANLLRSFMYILIEEYFDKNRDFLQLYNKAFMYNALARDIENVNGNSSKYLNFNEQQYNLLSEYKTGYQSFTLPLLLAMRLANRTVQKLCISVEKLCSEMGRLYQMTKDYNNCFRGETLIGTFGTDIQRGRCTWQAVTAVPRFTSRQRCVYAACYGSAAPAHVERIKLMYRQARLPQLFREQQAAMFEEIRLKAEDLEMLGFPSAVFLRVLDEIVRDETVVVNEGAKSNVTIHVCTRV